MPNMLITAEVISNQQVICTLEYIYLFGVLRHFQHCTDHITMGSWKGRGNQYIQFVRVLYCKLPTNGKQLPAFPLEAMQGTEPSLRGGSPECYHSVTMAPILEYNKYSIQVIYNMVQYVPYNTRYPSSIVGRVPPNYLHNVMWRVIFCHITCIYVFRYREHNHCIVLYCIYTQCNKSMYHRTQSAI